MRLLSEINFESTEEKILKFCQDISMMGLDVQVRQMYMDYGTNLLTIKQQQKLLIEQNEYNKKQLNWTRVMAVATVVSVLIALGFLKFDQERLDRNLNIFSGQKS